MQDRKRRVAVLGASGTVGRRIVEQLLARGFDVACQTRSADKMSFLAARASIHVFDPRETAKMSDFVSGVDAVNFALGADATGTSTLFSNVTAVLITPWKSIRSAA